MAGGNRALLRALGVAVTLFATGVTPAYAGQGTTAVAEAPSADWVWVRYLARAHPYGTAIAESGAAQSSASRQRRSGWRRSRPAVSLGFS